MTHLKLNIAVYLLSSIEVFELVQIISNNANLGVIHLLLLLLDIVNSGIYNTRQKKQS